MIEFCYTIASALVSPTLSGMHTIINMHIHIYVLIFNHLVTTPNVTTLPHNPIQGAMVGSPQDIQCIVSTVSGVELSSVMISWMGPGGESITNDSRVTISPTSSSGNNYTSSLQFTYLMEGDEGFYTCNVVILKTTNSFMLELSSLTSKLRMFNYVYLIGIITPLSYYKMQSQLIAYELAIT